MKTMKVEYALSPGSRIPMPPQVVGEELERIRGTYMELTAPAVVDSSRSKTAPLHSYFEWDDSVAGEAHRHEQARRLIRSVRIVSNPDKEPDIAWIHATLVNETDKTRRSVYRPSSEVMTDEALSSQAISEAIGMIEGLERRLRSLKAMRQFFAAIKPHVEELKKKVAKKKGGNKR